MIIINNEEALRVNCDDVLQEEVADLINQLEKELNYSNAMGRHGIGLAAPQIGIAKNIAIVRLQDFKFNLINAKIEKGFDSKVFANEGCLSFPGRIENTNRYQEVFVTSNLQEPFSFVATGLLAVVCQHELDHLNQKLFFDNKVLVKTKIGPNDKCLCNSGKKFKKCCGAK